MARPASSPSRFGRVSRLGLLAPLLFTGVALGAGIDGPGKAVSAAHVAGSPEGPGGARSSPSDWADTVLPVRRGDRLDLTSLEGELTIRTWNRDEVHVRDADDDEESPGLVRGTAGIGFGRPLRNRDLRVTVPPWLPVRISTDELELDVRGLRAELSVRLADGDVRLTDLEGDVDVWSVDGEIEAWDVAGAVVLGSIDESVSVRGARGTLTVSTTDGDLVLHEIGARMVDASTVDGDVEFTGRLTPGGEYRLVTHSGDLSVGLEPEVHAEVVVSTFDGSFEADVAVVLDRLTGGRRMSFVLGDGGASLMLEAFEGDIRLRTTGAGRGGRREAR